MDNRLRNTCIMTSLFFVMGSCSSYQRPESIQSKMSRFKSQNTYNNVVPRLEVASSAISGRTPASAATHRESSQKTSYEGHSNKRLYFIQLLDQYNQLNRFSSHSTGPELNHCPQFHTAIVEYAQKRKPITKRTLKADYAIEKIDNTSYLAAHPELSLPASNHKNSPTLANIILTNRKTPPAKFLSKTIALHSNRTYKELQELCEYGNSSNYYIFENMVTHIKRRGISSSNKSIQMLYKTTVYSNMAIIRSLINSSKSSGRTIASFQGSENFTAELLKRTNSQWFSNYLNSIR